MQSRVLILGLAVAATGCAAPPPRAKWQLTGGEGVFASNSRVVVEELQPVREGNTLVIHHPILLTNMGTEVASVGTGHGEATIGGVAVRLRCEAEGKKVRVLYLGPRERSRADCIVSLDPAVRSKIGRKDAELSITLPVRSVGGQSELSFSYQLWVDDLS